MMLKEREIETMENSRIRWDLN